MVMMTALTALKAVGATAMEAPARRLQFAGYPTIAGRRKNCTPAAVSIIVIFNTK